MRRLIRDFVVVMLSTWTIARTTLRRLIRGPKHPRWGYLVEVTVEVMRAVIRFGHEHMSVPMRRKQLVLPLPPRIARRVTFQRTTIAGVPTETLTPTNWKPADPTWVHFHGGAYSICSPATHRLMLARICIVTGARCVTPDYRKAPENPYPAPVDDCFDVYRSLIGEGVEDLIVGGDSAGGGLALAVMQRAKEHAFRLPRAVVLLSPWVDLTTTAGGSIESNRPFDYLAGEMLASAIADYVGGADPASPEISPVCADLSGLPPILVQSGGAEILLDQNRHLVELARAAGGEVLHEISEGMVHVFQFIGPFPAARRAVRSIGAFVASGLGSGALAAPPRAGPPPD